MSNPHDAAATGSLTSGEIDILITIERIGAGLSMLSVVCTITSFLCFKRLRTTPNLFLFLASTANAGASVASMIGYDGLDQGEDSSLCQAQAFIFQWFMQADPWWSFAMALNVYLVFFYNAQPWLFRKYVWVYCAVCFGVPLITAVALIAINGHARGPIYGNAALWCWIGANWSLVRLWSYYIPVWICIFLSIIIYVAVGYRVFHQRNQLRNIALENRGQRDTSFSRDSLAGYSAERLTDNPDFYGMAITEVQVTSDIHKDQEDKGCFVTTTIAHPKPTVQRDRPWVLDAAANPVTSNTSPKSQRFETVCTSDSYHPRKNNVFSRLRSAKSTASLRLKRLDPVKMAYLRTSFIFGFAVLITWIPSSINRLYSLTNNGLVSFPLSVASGCVLPLQGLWNAIIYFTTSWKTLQEELYGVYAKLSGRQDHGRRMTTRLDGCIDTLDGDTCVGQDRRRTQSAGGKLSEPRRHSLYNLELDLCER